MEYFSIDKNCGQAYPDFQAGILIIKNVENLKSHPETDKAKTKVINDIREKYANFKREDLNKLPVISAYNNYYKLLNKSYHVRAQVESVIGGKNLPGISAVLDSMFMSELKNMLLTAGHDLDTLNLPLKMSVATGEEVYIGMGNSEKKVYANDLFMSDTQGIISSIINGPDTRTKISSESKNLLFAVYAPAEIEKQAILNHLQDIKTAILSFSPAAKTELLEVFKA